MVEANNPAVRRLGLVEYEPTWRAMQRFTAERAADTADEIWLLQHPPVFTLGLAGKPEHLRRDIGVPLVHVDRGGQITYHGPGQIVAYLLLDLNRLRFKVRELVQAMEQAIIEESMTDEELAIARECDALDQSEYSPIPNIESIQPKSISQGATLCLIGVKTN